MNDALEQFVTEIKAQGAFDNVLIVARPRLFAIFRDDFVRNCG